MVFKWPKIASNEITEEVLNFTQNKQNYLERRWRERGQETILVLINQRAFSCGLTSFLLSSLVLYIVAHQGPQLLFMYNLALKFWFFFFNFALQNFQLSNLRTLIPNFPFLYAFDPFSLLFALFSFHFGYDLQMSILANWESIFILFINNKNS